MWIQHQASAAGAAMDDLSTSEIVGLPAFDPSDDERLDQAVSGLRRVRPDLSAHNGLSPIQLAIIVAMVLVCAGVLVWAPSVIVLIGEAIFAIVFALLIALRLAAIRHLISSRTHAEPVGPVTTAAATTGAAKLAGADALPLYSILVALHDEAAIARQLVDALCRIDYPTMHLQILFAIEAHDLETRAALLACDLPSHMVLITVPPGTPRTKPRALNFALTYARGQYVVVYDAEDAPEPGQLRAAVAAFKRGRPDLGCLQANLTIDTRAPGVIAAQFAVEYAVLFKAILPALAHHDLPVLLGGTSNHFPRHVLETVGGWDPYNVTEDADLGVRLARFGFHVDILPSSTLEDAPPDVRAWFAQRTRWQKGWLQTYCVHMRSPARLWRDLGPYRFAAFQIVLGGGLLCALTHPWFYAWVIVHAAHGTLAPPPSGLEAALWWIAVGNLVMATLAAVCLAVLALDIRHRYHLIPAALLSPLYRLPVSLAIYAAICELFVSPHYWAKTPHTPRVGTLDDQ